MKNNTWLAGEHPRNESDYTAPLFIESTGISTETKGKTNYISGHIAQGGFNWILSGTIERTVGTRQILAGPGHFFFNVSGEEVFFRVVSERCVWRWVALSGPLSDAILLSYRYARHQIPDHPYPAELFAKLDELMSRSSPFHTRLKAALILEILAYATGAGTELGESPKIIDRGLSLIKRELSNPDLCVDYLCQHLGISPATLTRIFRQEIRLSPGRYILNLRLKEAMSLLSGTDLPVLEITAQCGFRDPKTFSRFIKRATGSGPLAYRKATRKQNIAESEESNESPSGLHPCSRPEQTRRYSRGEQPK